MLDHHTLAEVYRMQHRLIDMSGGMPGVRDKGAVEAGVFRPQIGYYSSLEEEAAALLESLANNRGFLDGNKRGPNGAPRIPLRQDPRLDPPAHQSPRPTGLTENSHDSNLCVILAG